MHGDDTPGNRQAEARPALRLGEGVVSLLELLENFDLIRFVVLPGQRHDITSFGRGGIPPAHGRLRQAPAPQLAQLGVNGPRICEFRALQLRDDP